MGPLRTTFVTLGDESVREWLRRRGGSRRRYEQETTLSETRYFQDSAISFVFASNRRLKKTAHYSFHLFLVWGLPQSLFKRLKSLSDLPDKNYVLKHFSRSELGLSVIFGFFIQFLIVIAGFGLFERWYFSRWRPY